MKQTAYFFIIVGFLAFVTGCAELDSISETLSNDLFTDKNEETQHAQSAFDSQKSAIENRAAAGHIKWAQAARNVRDLDRSFTGKGRWKFDSDDEEYHAYCIATAEHLDNKQITFAQYDALRTQRFNQITARRQQINNSQPRRDNTNCRSVRNPDGSVSTNCY